MGKLTTEEVVKSIKDYRADMKRREEEQKLKKILNSFKDEGFGGRDLDDLMDVVYRDVD